MEIRITGKNALVTDAVKDWVFRKVSKIERYAPRLVESHVILKKEKIFYVAEITVLAAKHRIYGEGRDKENLYTAIDWACERVGVQLKKFREKIKGHHLSERRRIGNRKKAKSIIEEGESE